MHFQEGVRGAPSIFCWPTVRSMRRLRPKAKYGILALFSLILLAAIVTSPFREWRRASNAPILSPRDGWHSAGTFNPAVVLHHGKFVMLYRVQDNHRTSRLGCAESADGVHFTRRAQPVLSLETEYEKDGGVEDPRLVNLADTYYLTLPMLAITPGNLQESDPLVTPRRHDR